MTEQKLCKVTRKRKGGGWIRKWVLKWIFWHVSCLCSRFPPHPPWWRHIREMAFRENVRGTWKKFRASPYILGLRRISSFFMGLYQDLEKFRTLSLYIGLKIPIVSPILWALGLGKNPSYLTCGHATCFYCRDSTGIFHSLFLQAGGPLTLLVLSALRTYLAARCRGLTSRHADYNVISLWCHNWLWDLKEFCNPDFGTWNNSREGKGGQRVRERRQTELCDVIRLSEMIHRILTKILKQGKIKLS